MALDCGKIASGIVAAVCGKVAASGTTGRVILMNYNDIDKGESEVTGNVASGITLKAGAQGYEYEAFRNGNDGAATLTRGTYRTAFDHSLSLRLFTKNQDAKDFINSLSNARVVAIVENNEGGDAGETKWEVYGWDSGLTASEITASTTYTDNAAYSITLNSDDNSKEGQLPLSFFKTDLATTEQMITALLSPAA